MQSKGPRGESGSMAATPLGLSLSFRAVTWRKQHCPQGCLRIQGNVCRGTEHSLRAGQLWLGNPNATGHVYGLAMNKGTEKGGTAGMVKFATVKPGSGWGRGCRADPRPQHPASTRRPSPQS